MPINDPLCARPPRLSTAVIVPPHLERPASGPRLMRALAHCYGHSSQSVIARRRVPAKFPVAAPPGARACLTMALRVGATTPAATKKLEQLSFDNLSLRVLPVDPNPINVTRQVEGACFSRVQPTPVANPKLVAASPEALALLDIDPAEVEAAPAHVQIAATTCAAVLAWLLCAWCWMSHPPTHRGTQL